MECIASLDQGTQSTRLLLYDAEAQLIDSHHMEFTQITPQPGWVEHDPMEIWDSVLQCIEKGLSQARSRHPELKVTGLGITNQRETTMAWDRTTGQPLHNAIVWMDRRTAAICQRLSKELGSGDAFRETTGLPISTYFSAFKWLWLLENVEAVQQAAAEGRCMVGTMDTWLMYNLTGGAHGGIFVTDVSNAARTCLMDIKNLQWAPDLLQRFRLSTDMLPRICSNAEIYGHVRDGPLTGVPIAGCLGDQHAALLGQRCRPLEAKNTYGTGCFLLLHTGTEPVPSQAGLLTTMAYQLGPEEPPQYALEGSIAIAGAGVSWLRDRLGLIDSVDECEAVASSVPDTGGVFFVPAFSGLLAPHWRSDARGVILGLSSYSGKAHIVRALLEAITWQTKEVLQAMLKDAKQPNFKLLRVDGGASRNNLLMQLQADAIQIPVRRPEHLETTSLGAAFAAGIATGFWTKEWVLGSTSEEKRHGDYTDFLPKVDPATIEKRFRCWEKAVERSFDLEDFDAE
ncbi:g12320 [Coccomyxa viridis]|uniref:glycerol kinase n=1 Tax=Coccomyxa viridis TaxID=1274662 RepID=A0ABP1GA35_9CHLO